MKKIVNTRPETFFSEDVEIKIYDSKKKHFYFRKNPDRNITFNLPKGEYYSDNNLEKQNLFIPYPVSYTGFKDGWVNEIDFYVCHNENKATIFPTLKRPKVFLDNKIANHVYKPLTMFLLSHEVSHREPEGRGIECNSNTANFCDINGANYLINKVGLNPSQIVLATKILYKEGMRGICTLAAMSNFKR